MGRRKTIADAEVLAIARAVFLERGHVASTRDIAAACGVSEAILYQRFGTKDDLFFAAMRPAPADIEHLLGPKDLPDDARAYLRAVVARIGKHFAEVIPLAVQIMMHPSSGPRQPQRRPVSSPLHDALAERLAELARHERIAGVDPKTAARMLVSLAHDWALGTVMNHGPGAPRVAELGKLVDLAWRGLQPTR